MVEGEAQRGQAALGTPENGVTDRTQEDDVVALNGLEVPVSECRGRGCSAAQISRRVVDALVRQDAVQDLQALGRFPCVA